MRATTVHVVYECAGCEERFVDERRCPECNLFCRSLGEGGRCPSCGEIVSKDELEEG
jgi:ssDNA-binding Zn-finger/Zn-ribbon topoisomerase 1